MKRKILFVAVIMLLLLVAVYSGVQLMESSMLGGPNNAVTVSSKTIVRDGIEYYPNQDITVILLMGIDQDGIAEPSGSYNNKGSADAVSLLIFDKKRQVCDILCLNRDTMMDIPVLGIGGRQAGTVYAQLATSHTYGSGMEDSCQNTRQAVSDFLYGLEIDYYISMHMDGIPVLNDAVGGVEVNVMDDFSQIDPSIPMGTVRLNGRQAYNYIRSRKDVGNQLNISRMDRQKEYITGLMSALKGKLRDNESYAVELFDQLSDYVVTDCSTNSLSRLISDYFEYPIGEVIDITGTNVRGEQFYEFYADEKALDAMILTVFYEEK